MESIAIEHRARPRTVRAAALRVGLMVVALTVAALLGTRGLAGWWVAALAAFALAVSLLEWWYRRTVRLTLVPADGVLRISLPHRTTTVPIAGTSVRVRRIGAGERLWWFEAADGTRVWMPTWNGHDELLATLHEAGLTAAR